MNSGKRIAGIAALLIILLGAGAYWHWKHPKKAVKRPPLTQIGVGLYLGRNKDTGQFQVRRIFPNSPAERAGLVPGLVLNKVGNVLAEKETIQSLSALLRGPVGSTVTVEMIDTNNDATNQIEIIRDQFVNHSTK